MVRGVVRAAAYLPRFTEGGLRVGGFDEDGVTYAAAALELASRMGLWDQREPSIQSFGLDPPLENAALAAILGAPVRGVPEDPDASFGRAVERARQESGPAWIVAVSVRSPRGGPRPPGEGGIAILIDEAPGAVDLHLPSDLSRATGPEVFAPLLALGQLKGGLGTTSGDWGIAPSASSGLPPGGEREVGAPTGSVSQGAFVPGPRYEESRPSRWGLIADSCSACGHRTFPSRGRCRHCGATSGLRPERLPLRGATVLAVTWIGQGGQPTEFDPQVERTGPYGVVLAEVAPGVRVTLPLAVSEPRDVKVGTRVDTVLRRLYSIEGSWRYGRKAVASAPGTTVGGGAAPPPR